MRQRYTAEMRRSQRFNCQSETSGGPFDVGEKILTRNWNPSCLRVVISFIVNDSCSQNCSSEQRWMNTASKVHLNNTKKYKVARVIRSCGIQWSWEKENANTFTQTPYRRSLINQYVYISRPKPHKRRRKLDQQLRWKLYAGTLEHSCSRCFWDLFSVEHNIFSTVFHKHEHNEMNARLEQVANSKLTLRNYQ